MTMNDGPQVLGEVSGWNCRRVPDAEAVVDGTRRLTWCQLHERTNRVASALRDRHGVRKGDRVAYLGNPTLEGLELLHAVPRLGAIVVPLNDRFATAELEQVMAVTEPVLLVCDGAFQDVAARLAASAGIACVGADPSHPLPYDELVEAGSADEVTAAIEPTDVASLCFTSGTTGAPKGVMMLHGAQVAFAAAMELIEPIHAGARHLFVRPLSVAPGHRMVAWHGLLGGTTVLLPRFSPADLFRTVEAEGITNVLLAPTTLRMLLDHGNPDGHDLSSLQSIVYGGAPMPPNLLAEVLDFFSCQVGQGYGSSEAGQVLYLSDDDHRAGRLTSNGHVVPGVEISIRDEDGGKIDRGGTGELHVRSPQLFGGYWREPGKTAAALRDGWYRTGDLCVDDGDGTYRLVGRATEMIISGGFNVMPREVEQVLAGHPAVLDVAVVAVPDRTWGDLVGAVVVLRPGAGVTADELADHCRQRLASFKKPRLVCFVGALPLTRAGKVDRTALTALLLDVEAPTRL
jgi:acyl-CoA synthetase (AMP-forming)/AMP-acid ligase II